MSTHPFDAEDAEGLYCACGLPARHPMHETAAALPETPYAGTSGWSGSDTSRERAEDADADGTTSERQRVVLTMLANRAATGMTWREVADTCGWHHGQASGALSVLHKEGRIARLTERRSRCAVYVLPEHVNGRETAEHGRDRLTPDERAALGRVERLLSYDGTPDQDDVETVAAALRRIAG